MKAKCISLAMLYLSFQAALFAQNNFDFQLNPVGLTGMQGIQSYAFGTHENYTLIVGGRIDGLHRRQPWASFDEVGRNTVLYVIDMNEHVHWQAELENWPDEVADQLGSTNMEFFQRNNTLYLIGGYGWSAAFNDHVTFDQLIAIEVEETINAIIQGEEFMDHFRYVEEDEFAVTGGQVYEMDDVVYLVGGQRFDGAYNPMNNPTFVQDYTSETRRFILTDDGVDIDIEFLEPWTNEDAFHRRDFNVLPQIFPGENLGLTAFSGVFQIVEDIPYLNTVDIQESGFSINNDFTQHYNHYHCAKLAMYDSESEYMHNVFFGGIAQFYDENGVLIQDLNVPFVKTIARVSRNGSGQLTEHKFNAEMPGFLGASAEFIPLHGLPIFENGVIKMDELEGDTVLIGHIYGGINSSASNIFWVNNGTQSSADNSLMEVYLIQNLSTNINELNEQSEEGYHLQSYYDYDAEELVVSFALQGDERCSLKLFTLQGELIEELINGNCSKGLNRFRFKHPVDASSLYLLELVTNRNRLTQKLIVSP